MSNEIKVFNNAEFGSIRAVTINNEPWFVAKDISDKLGYFKTGNMTKLIDEDDMKYTDPQSPEFIGKLQYAVVTCTVRHKGEYIIGLKTYLGKADYKDFSRLRALEAENEMLLKSNADKQMDIERLQTEVGYW